MKPKHFEAAASSTGPSASAALARQRKMRVFVQTAGLVLLCGLLSGCGLFDSGVVWKGGHYAMIWIDIPDDVQLSYDAGNGAWMGRVEARVFAVGWDGRYVVAKQHPKGNKSVTNYFIVDSQKDSSFANTTQAVIGPLSVLEFQKRSAEMKLPRFTKLLGSLQ
jgi:hypothetical protein